MDTSDELTRRLLEQEARAWREFTPGEYDRALCKMIENLGPGHESAVKAPALIMLASVALRRSAPGLIESRACIAERLLALNSSSAALSLQQRIHLLFLLAWLRLGADAAAGPNHISSVPDFPPGVVLPSGADPEVIADPVLRQKAHELARRHSEEVERWTAKQRAIDHLHHLAALVRAIQRDSGERGEPVGELQAAMSMAPGLTPELRKLLEDGAQS